MRPVLITGASGTLGTAFRQLCEARRLDVHAVHRAVLDITSDDSIASAIDRYEPWLIVNAAGYVRVDDAEADADRCRLENTTGPALLAKRCAAAGVALLSFSSDLVFDGSKGRPYEEGDALAPLSVYGRTKAEAEERILTAHPGALVVRTSAFFGPWDAHNFVTKVITELGRGGVVHAAGNTIVSPTYLPDLVHVCLDLAIDEEAGIWHLANRGTTTWAGLARSAAVLAGYDAERVLEVPMAALGLPARRPPYSALGSVRGGLLPTLEDALGRYGRARA